MLYPRLFLLRLLLLLPLMLLVSPAQALWLEPSSHAALGREALYFQEEGQELRLEEVVAAQKAGRFTPRSEEVPSFGIGPRPVWLHLGLDNAQAEKLLRHIVVGVTWIDRLDVYLLRDGQLLQRWQAGDAHAGWQHPEPGLGFVFAHEFAPGRTELFIRAQTPDPLVLSLQLLSAPDYAVAERSIAYSYGLVYGLLLALVAYNSLLYVGMRLRTHRDYAIYLSLFFLLNVGYTGHGYAWLWPGAPYFQNYVVLVLMVLVPCAGFRFASGFLELRRYSPRLHMALQAACLALLLAILFLTVLKWHREAALLSFSVFSAFAFVMVLLGVHAIRQRRTAARYFLAGASSAMLGAAITSLTVWGFLPYSSMGFRAAEIGFSVEAILLSLAVAYHVRQQERARRAAEELARVDPLTGLLNRRAFLEAAEALWPVAYRHERSLVLVMLDLDHFKAVNERYGHGVGDAALQAVSQFLQQAVRPGDVLARWGGEEFVLLLPELTEVEGWQFADRLRRQLCAETVQAGSVPLFLQASFGVAASEGLNALGELMHEADRQLYRAKQAGCNLVCCASVELPPASVSAAV